MDNLFNLLNSDEIERNKEDVKNVLNTFLVYLSLEGIVRNIGIIVASCTNKEVLLNASKFLSIFCELWENSEERGKISQFYAEEQFSVFMNIVYENDADKDIFAALSDKVITISHKLLKEHILQYNTIEDSDLEFIFNLAFMIKVSLDSGGYESIPNKLFNSLQDVQTRIQESGIDVESSNVQSVLRIISNCSTYIESLRSENGEEDDDSCSTTSQSSINSPRTFGTPQTFDTPQSSFNTPRH